MNDLTDSPDDLTGNLLGDMPEADTGYQVLARKYRPQTFDDLMGHGAMKDTLTHAFEAGRIAHGFILTGIRGIGKTTTARILARALNCVGPDGTGGPTIKPCGECDPCQAIAKSSHVDVLEMDAASRTGINDIREIIDGVHYAPASARFKVYIIDEVHMLSTAAFNGLLKTLEEPPPHVKFIFATTEIRKVPVTVLSRCQRFDLRRLHSDELIALLKDIAGKEGAALDDEALALIARAAEGSARDGVSLLDQAIGHNSSGADAITADQVRVMLGLADRARIIDLFDHVMAGRVPEALEEMAAQHHDGADPLVILDDLAAFTHWATRIKVVPTALDDPSFSEDEKSRGAAMAEALPMPALTRAWQMLLKGIGEARMASDSLAAAEMILIRLSYAADLPDPGSLVKQLQDGGGADASGGPASGGSGGTPSGGGVQARLRAVAGGGRPAVVADAAPQADSAPQTEIASFQDAVRLVGQQDIQLRNELERSLRVLKFEQGQIEVAELGSDAPRQLLQRLSGALMDLTGDRWVISVGRGGGDAATLREDRDREVREDPLVKAVLETFPGAEIRGVRDLAAEAVGGLGGDDVPLDPDAILEIDDEFMD